MGCLTLCASGAESLYEHVVLPFEDESGHLTLQPSILDDSKGAFLWIVLISTISTSIWFFFRDATVRTGSQYDISGDSRHDHTPAVEWLLARLVAQFVDIPFQKNTKKSTFVK